MTHRSFLCRAAVVALKAQAHGGAGLETAVQGLPSCLVDATPEALNQHTAQPISCCPGLLQCVGPPWDPPELSETSQPAAARPASPCTYSSLPSSPQGATSNDQVPEFLTALCSDVQPRPRSSRPKFQASPSCSHPPGCQPLLWKFRCSVQVTSSPLTIQRKPEGL